MPPIGLIIPPMGLMAPALKPGGGPACGGGAVGAGAPMGEAPKASKLPKPGGAAGAGAGAGAGGALPKASKPPMPPMAAGGEGAPKSAPKPPGATGGAPKPPPKALFVWLFGGGAGESRPPSRSITDASLGGAGAGAGGGGVESLTSKAPNVAPKPPWAAGAGGAAGVGMPTTSFGALLPSTALTGCEASAGGAAGAAGASEYQRFC